jgi:hypothetical protein
VHVDGATVSLPGGGGFCLGSAGQGHVSQDGCGWARRRVLAGLSTDEALFAARFGGDGWSSSPRRHPARGFFCALSCAPSRVLSPIGTLFFPPPPPHPLKRAFENVPPSTVCLRSADAAAFSLHFILKRKIPRKKTKRAKFQNRPTKKMSTKKAINDFQEGWGSFFKCRAMEVRRMGRRSNFFS